MHTTCCQICGIKTARLNGQKRIFMAKFPLREEICKQWVKATGNEDLVYLPMEKLHQLKSICGKHFRPKDFNKKKTQLKKTAVPTIDVAARPLDDALFVNFPLYVRESVKREKSQRLKPTIRKVLPITVLEHDYCSFDVPETKPVPALVDDLPEKEEQSYSPEPMACDVDDPLAACMSDADDNKCNIVIKRRTSHSPEPSVSSSAALPENDMKRRKILCPAPSVSNLQAVSENDIQIRYMHNPVPATLSDAVRAALLVNNSNARPPPIPQPTTLLVVRQTVPVNHQIATSSPNPQPRMKNTEGTHKPQMCKREKLLLAKFAALKKEVKVLRKRVRQIDKISSPVLKTLIESSIHNQGKKSRGQRWSQLHKSVALNIYKRSPKTYLYFRHLMPMPSVKTLQTIMVNNLTKTEPDADADDDTVVKKPSANTSFRDIAVNEFNENDDLAIGTTSLTSPQSMEDQMDKLRKHVRHLTTVANKLKNQNKLLRERLANNTKTNEKMLNTITANMTPAAKVFTKMQYSKTAKQPEARRYSAEEKILAVSMYNSSPAGYVALSHFFTLPTERLIEKFTREVQAGLCQSIEANEQELNKSSVQSVNKSSVQSDSVNSRRIKAKVGRSNRGRGGKWSAHRGEIGRENRLPPPPRLTAASATYADENVHEDVYSHRSENVILAPEVHSTMDIRDVEIHDAHYRRNIDMALAGLTSDMPEL